MKTTVLLLDLGMCESKKPRFRYDFLTDFFWQGVRRFANWQFSPGRKGKFKAKFWHKRNYGNGIFDMIWPTPVQGHLQ